MCTSILSIISFAARTTNGRLEACVAHIAPSEYYQYFHSQLLTILLPLLLLLSQTRCDTLQPAHHLFLNKPCCPRNKTHVVPNLVLGGHGEVKG